MQEISLVDVIARLLPSLALVVGGLLLVRRLALRQRGGVQRQMRVIARVGLSRSASVQVVQVGDLHYLVGATEQNVNLLAELPDDVVEQFGSAALLAARSQDAGATGGAPGTNNASPWTGLVERLQEATLRRSRDPGAGRVR